MAKAKRENQRTEPEQPHWTPANTTGANGTGEPGTGGSGPALDVTVDEHSHNLNGHSQSAEHNGINGNGVAKVVEFATTVRLDEIALAAIALSDGVQAATAGLPESVEARQYRRDLDEAADRFRAVATELETTAGNLVRLAANEGHSCAVAWGVCPEHGLTLMNVGEDVTCHVLGCYSAPEGAIDRCPQTVAYKVVDAAGPALFVCSGHAIACRLHLEDAVITLASDSLELL
jgi:hypothetical protein